MARQTKCDECDGTGKVRPFEFQGETRDECPWCQGTGKVDVLYVVRSHGHNGDFPFCEVHDVVPSLAKAKKIAERVMKTDRYRNVHEGKPTIQWMEVDGPGIEESLGLEESREASGTFVWNGC